MNRADGRGYPFSAIVGQEQLRSALLLLAVDPAIGGVLIRGHKGTAKTTAVRALADVVPGRAGTGRAPFVDMPLGATEDRVVGSLDLDALAETGRPRFRPGLLGAADGGLLYVDEVNLLADHLVDVLLDAASSGVLSVERDGVSHTEPTRFALVGTMNPEEGELRPQLLDRFGLAVDVAGPTDAALRVEIVRRRREFDTDPAGFRARFAADDAAVAADVVAARELLPAVDVPDRELTRIALVCLEVGVEGMRADVVIARAAAAHAALDGRIRVTEDDVRAAAEVALPHRRRRDPFDTAEMDPDELDRAMDAAGEQLGDDPDDDPEGPDGSPDGGPGDGPDGDGSGPDGGGGDDAVADDDSPGDDHPGQDGPRPDAPDARADTDGVPGEPAVDAPGDADEGERGDAPADTPTRGGTTPDAARTHSRVPPWRIPGFGRGAAGRRSGAVTSSGRLVPAPAHTPGARPHVLATVRAALVRTLGEPSGPALSPADLRHGVRRGREGNLVVFLVDTSGSMAARRRLDAVTGSCVALLRDAYVRRDLVAVVTARGDRAAVTVPPTRSVDVAVRRLADVPTGGRTPLAEGLAEVTSLLLGHRLREPDRRALLVVLTDGRATAGADAPRRASETARGLRARRLATTVVVDCEAGRVRLGAAGALARELGAPVVPLESFGDDTVARLVRAA